MNTAKLAGWAAMALLSPCLAIAGGSDNQTLNDFVNNFRFDSVESVSSSERARERQAQETNPDEGEVRLSGRTQRVTDETYSAQRYQDTYTGQQIPPSEKPASPQQPSASNDSSVLGGLGTVAAVAALWWALSDGGGLGSGNAGDNTALKSRDEEREKAADRAREEARKQPGIFDVPSINPGWSCCH